MGHQQQSDLFLHQTVAVRKVMLIIFFYSCDVLHFKDKDRISVDQRGLQLKNTYVLASRINIPETT